MLVWKYRNGQDGLVPGVAAHSIVDKLLSVRGLSDRNQAQVFLMPEYERDLFDPFLFLAMEAVVERIGKARDRNEIIGVFGDFDADGLTSSVIIRHTLQTLGIRTVVYIPHKIDEGHGLNRQAVDFFCRAGARLIFTLDCGMMNYQEIEYAKTAGVEVIIIDHHHVPEILPPALAIINPKLPQERYPFRDLCGAGTSFKVATALYRRFLPEKAEHVKWLLDLAAIGTVADVMPLIGENRALVKYGLIVLQKTRRVGLQEMFRVGKISVGDSDPPNAELIAFQIAPRLNAASRMAHPMVAHDLLMEENPVRARTLALELEAYNSARQKVSQETTNAVRTIALERFRDKKFIFAVSPEYPLGVAGLVAGRIAHEFGKPTAVCHQGETTSTGSFRSIPGLNIIEALEICAPLLEKYGGHDQAAGMTIKNENLDFFYERFNSIVEQALFGKKTEPELIIDLILEPTDISLSLARAIRTLEPFGEGNPEPVFALMNMTVLEARTVGKNGQHWKLKLKNGGAPEVFDAVGWSLVDVTPKLTAEMKVNIAFQLMENNWNGRSSVQLKLIDIDQVN